jgi:hypothetical protein
MFYIINEMYLANTILHCSTQCINALKTSRNVYINDQSVVFFVFAPHIINMYYVHWYMENRIKSVLLWTWSFHTGMSLAFHLSSTSQAIRIARVRVSATFPLG